MTNQEYDQLDKLMAEGPMGGIKTLEDANKAGSQERPFVTEDCDGVLWLVVSLMRDAVRWQPSRLIQQAMIVMKKEIGDGIEGPTPMIYYSSGSWWCRLSGLGTAYGGDEPEEAICLAVKAARHGKGGDAA